MEKRYQIFISSTFKDLQDERQSLLKAVLELNHMPAGMELFPATDDTAWQLIKDIIDASDYYTLVVAGRYGSLDEAGLGYTEKEYDYAVKTNKPVIPLLHKNPDNLPRDKTETDEATWKKLKSFRAKVEKKHTCVYWTTSEDLKAKVIIGLTAAFKRHPAVGWVRADQVPNEATLGELLKLKSQIVELEKAADESNTKPPVGAEDLVQGDERFDLNCEFVSRNKIGSFPYHDDIEYTGVLSPSWNQIFAAIAPCMINEASNQTLRNKFRLFLTDMGEKQFSKEKKLKGTELRRFVFKEEEIDTCVIQLRALGLIKENRKQRSVKDTTTYWTLTPYGDVKMVQLRAIHREPIDDEIPIASKEQEQK